MFSTNLRKNSHGLSAFLHGFGLLLITLCGAALITDAQTRKGVYLDFTGDGKTDWAVIRTPRTRDENYRWKILGNQLISTQNPPFISIFDYGLISDVLLPGDYIGDRKTEPTVWRPDQQSTFYVAQLPTGTNGIKLDRAVPWGIGGISKDVSYPQGDYDGDGKLDYTVLRYSTDGLTWHILNSSTYTWRSVVFGFRDIFSGTFPGADFNGDGRDELVFNSKVNGNLFYYIGDAVTGTLIFAGPWGKSENFIDNNLPPADYTGDGKADLIAVRKNLNRMVWYILDPTTNRYTATEFGFGIVVAGDRPDYPVQGDFDGDGRFDIAVYRPTNHTFYVLKSLDGGLMVQPWGDDGDSPLSIGYVAYFFD